jgi:hypothetical protein
MDRHGLNATSGRAYVALAVAFLVACALFIDCHAERWLKSLAPRADPRTAAGEGLVIRSDGHGYYAWLRSLLFDGDWSFDNEFDEHNPVGDWLPPATPRSERGLRPNPWSVGPACAWALTVVPAHFAWAAAAIDDPARPTTGYELPYQLLVGGTTLGASALTLLCLYGIGRRFASPPAAALAAGLLFLGSTAVYYSAVEVSMAHGLGTAAVAGLIWYWLKSYGSDAPRRWFVVGLLVGLSALMRWQLATFAVIPAGEYFLTLYRRWRAGQALAVGKAAACLIALGLGAVVGFLPQLIAWHEVYGTWVTSPMATAGNWVRPSLGAVLVSPDRGLFYWTPLTLIALCGLVAGCRRPVASAPLGQVANGDRLALLLGAFALQLYVVASLLGEEVRLGSAFGFRFLTESVAALAPGLALLFEQSSPRRAQALCALGCLLVVWNLLLIGQYRYGLVPAAGGADPATLAANALDLVVRKKARLVALVLVGPVLLWLLLGRVLPASRKQGLASGSGPA